MYSIAPSEGLAYGLDLRRADGGLDGHTVEINCAQEQSSLRSRVVSPASTSDSYLGFTVAKTLLQEHTARPYSNKAVFPSVFKTFLCSTRTDFVQRPAALTRSLKRKKTIFITVYIILYGAKDPTPKIIKVENSMERSCLITN